MQRQLRTSHVGRNLRRLSPLMGSTWGNACPQDENDMVDITTAAVGEDCLFLNVWTSASASNESLPVYVWIQGGRWTKGSGSISDFDGAALASKGLVVVTINYRLSVLGFLATQELLAETSHNSTGNYAILDQIFALQWVQSNIAAFGGDPAKVTIGGQSAGAGSVYLHVLSPLSAGLFRGGITESGMRYPHDPLIWGMPTSYRNMTHALALSAEYMADHNVSTIAEARALSLESIMEDAQPNDASPYAYSVEIPPYFRPTLDGYVMPMSYSEALESGSFNDVAIINGYTANEAGGAVDNTVNTVELYKEFIVEKYGEEFLDEFLELYPVSSDDDVVDQVILAAQEASRVGMWLYGNEFSKHVSSPYFSYFWTHPIAGDELGAEHSAEIMYCFNNLYVNTDYNWSDSDYMIADVASTYWYMFIKTGDPNNDVLPAWPANSANATMHLDM